MLSVAARLDIALHVDVTLLLLIFVATCTAPQV